MAAFLWVSGIAAAWLVLSCAGGLLFGAVVRRRDELEAPGWRNPVLSVDDLEAMFVLDDSPLAAAAKPGQRPSDRPEISSAYPRRACRRDADMPDAE